jgi:hypothetical protein
MGPLETPLVVRVEDWGGCQEMGRLEVGYEVSEVKDVAGARVHALDFGFADTAAGPFLPVAVPKEGTSKVAHYITDEGVDFIVSTGVTGPGFGRILGAPITITIGVEAVNGAKSWLIVSGPRDEAAEAVFGIKMFG